MKKKRVLLLSQSWSPETNALANRLGVLARKLVEHYEVCVITLKPSYPSPSLFEAFPLEHHDRALPYQIKRAFSFHPHKGGLFLRVLREQAMALGLMVRAALTPADIVLASSPSMFLGPVGLMLARAKRAKFVWDVRDLTWRYGKEVSGATRVMALGARALEAYMLPVAHRTDLLIAATPGIARLLVEGGLAPEKVITVPNGLSQDVLKVAHRATGYNPRPIRSRVVYAGLIGYNQGLGTLLDAAGMLPEVDFILAGDGPELPLLKRKARKFGLANVSFRGYLSREDLLKVYVEGHVLFAKVRSTPTLDVTAVPSKLFEYMATGRPIVYAGKGLAVEFLNEIGCAVTVPPEDPEAIAAAIRHLLQAPNQMRVLGSKGREFVQQNYQRDKLMQDLVRTLKERFA